ncbi:hypothetical protein D3C78_1574760 [compost metagenome]
MCICGPDLRAVENIVITIGYGAHLQRGEVGACAGLGETLAPIVFTREDAWQVMELLFVSTETDDHRADQSDAHGVYHWRARQRTFGLENETLDGSPVRATPLLWP